MAVVSISEGVVQGFARDALEHLLRGMRPLAPTGSALVVAIDDAELEDMGVLDLKHFPLSDLRIVADVLRQYRQILEEQGPSSFASPEFFPGHCRVIDNLSAKVDVRIAELAAG